MSNTGISSIFPEENIHIHNKINTHRTSYKKALVFFHLIYKKKRLLYNLDF